MAAKKVGSLIKEARTKAKLTQEQLAKKIAGLSAADVSAAERGELTLTQEQMKNIAKALGITQKSLLDAAKEKDTAAKPASAKKPSSAKKPASASSGSVKLTADEKKLLELYRKADDDTKKAACQLLEKGAEETGNLLSGLLGGSNNNNSGSSGGGLLGSLFGGGNNNGNNNSGGGANLLGALLGGGSNNNNSGNSGGNLLGSLLGGMLGKREMPEGEENGEEKKE